MEKDGEGLGVEGMLCVEDVWSLRLFMKEVQAPNREDGGGRCALEAGSTSQSTKSQPHVASRCSTLPHVAPRCPTLPHVATRCLRKLGPAQDLITRALHENENLATMTALDDARHRVPGFPGAVQFDLPSLEAEVFHRRDVERGGEGGGDGWSDME